MTDAILSAEPEDVAFARRIQRCQYAGPGAAAHHHVQGLADGEQADDEDDLADAVVKQRLAECQSCLSR